MHGLPRDESVLGDVERLLEVWREQRRRGAVDDETCTFGTFLAAAAKARSIKNVANRIGMFCSIVNARGMTGDVREPWGVIEEEHWRKAESMYQAFERRKKTADTVKAIVINSRGADELPLARHYWPSITRTEWERLKGEHDVRC